MADEFTTLHLNETPENKADKIIKTDAEWRQLLSPEQYQIMRGKGTERPFTGALLNNHHDGIYRCGAC